MSCKCELNNVDESENIAIPLNEEDCYFVQKYLFEKEGLKELVKQFTSDSPFNVDEKRYKELLHGYIEAFIKYNIAFDNVIKKYDDKIKEKVNTVQYTPLMDFRHNELIITLNK